MSCASKLTKKLSFLLLPSFPLSLFVSLCTYLFLKRLWELSRRRCIQYWHQLHGQVTIEQLQFALAATQMQQNEVKSRRGREGGEEGRREDKLVTCAAMNSGVEPMLLALLMSAPASSNAATISAWPFCECVVARHTTSHHHIKSHHWNKHECRKKETE